MRKAVSAVSTRKRRARIAAAKKGWRTRKRRKATMDQLVADTTQTFLDVIIPPMSPEEMLPKTFKRLREAGVVIPPRRSDRDES